MSNTAYAFVGGVLIGKVTNWISSIIITGITLFYVKPDFYTYQTLSMMKTNLYQVISYIKT